LSALLPILKDLLNRKESKGIKDYLRICELQRVGGWSAALC
jgi:hypothetical protein